MGKFINIGLTDFQSVRKDEYVDKSMLIAYVNSVLGTQRKFLCVTRARRFGKSIAAKMLCAYYDESVDSRSLFGDLKIANYSSYKEHINQYPVIYLDVTRFTSKVSLPIDQIVLAIDEALKDEVRRVYSEMRFDAKDDLQDMLRTVVEQTGKQFIMIIDEWDAICRESNNDEVMRQYVNWLRGLFKAGAADRVFAGVYMTGILPIKQYNTQSALNNFEEFSMINPGPLAGYFGFTKEEVAYLADKYEVDKDELRRWYDGYQIGKLTEIYNPYAVMRAVLRQSIESYWTATATYEMLQRYISMNFDGLRDAVIELMADNSVHVDVLDFTNDMHEINNRNAVITLLIHLGYLSYDNVAQTAWIPNYEVRREFARAVQDNNWKYISDALRNSEQLLNDTLAGNEKAVADAIGLVHQAKTSILKYNNENSLACVLSIAYQMAYKDYDVVREMPTGNGFADIVLVPRRNVDKPAVVVELKWNKSAEGAIKQIKEQQYMDALRDYVGEVVLVGINYSKRTKLHSCVIERVDTIHQTGHERGQVRGQVQRLILAIEHATLSRQEIMDILRLRSRDKFISNYLRPALADEYIAMSIPETPNDPNQAYYLTPKGLKKLAELENK